jgi:hypothetical protein
MRISHESLMTVIGSARNWQMKNLDTGEVIPAGDWLNKDWSEVVKWSMGEGTVIPLDIYGQQNGAIWRILTNRSKNAVKGVAA